MMHLNDRFAVSTPRDAAYMFECMTCGAGVFEDAMETHNDWHNEQENQIEYLARKARGGK